MVEGIVYKRFANIIFGKLVKNLAKAEFLKLFIQSFLKIFLFYSTTTVVEFAINKSKLLYSLKEQNTVKTQCLPQNN